MTVHKSILTAATAVLFALCTTGSPAADNQPVPPTVAGQASMPGTTVPVRSCPTCGSGNANMGGYKSCPTCGSSWLHHHTKGPYVVNLCPGACFGYFQTHWRKWDDVCPYPYQGIGVSDAPKPPAPVLPAVTIPKPRPVETKP
jgi:hypothetical protein